VKRLLLLAAAAAGTLVAPTASSALNVYAATSLTKVMPEIKRDARYSFGGSNTLQLQIERGAPADLFLSAEPNEAQALYRAGRCQRPVTFATNRLVLIVRDGDPKKVGSIYRLRKGGLNLSIGSASVPVGAYTRQLLRRLRLSSALTANKVSQQSNVGQVLSQVAFGGADAGFVYATDARTQAGRIDPLYGGALPGLRGQAVRRGRAGRPGVAERHPQLARARVVEALRLRAAAEGMMGRAWAALVLGLVVAFLAVPVVALFVEAPLGDLPSLLREDVVRDAIWVTVKTNVAANIIIIALGTPAAWVLATRRFAGRTIVLTLCELPLVLPPAVAGIALLSAYAQGGVFGDALDSVGVVLPFGPWAVVIAVVFVASPFYVRQAVATFEAIDSDMVDVARTLGAGRVATWWRVVLPLAASGLAAGWVLAFARGVGEFGATIIFAGNVQGKTTTLTLAVYQELDNDLDVALALGVLLVVLSAGVLLSYKLLAAWRPSNWTSPAGFATSRSS
jgi:molybdate transport system permease protein